MKRVLICLFAGAMLLLLATVGTGAPDAAAQIPADQSSGHAIDTNEDGDVAIAAVKESGALWTRTLIDGVWSSWQKQGVDTWVSADVAIDDDGNIALIGLKQSGRLWTRDFTAGAWGSWTNQGLPTWSTETIPSIDKDGTTTTFGAVKESGALYTRTRTDGSSWGSWIEWGGRRNWVHADIAVYEDGVSMLAGTKEDGKIYTRVITPDPSVWELQGAAGAFSTALPPSISIHEDVVALAVINEVGEAFIRTGTIDTSGTTPIENWQPFDTAIEADVVGIEAAVANGRIAFIYATTAGETLKWGWQGAPGSWTPDSRPVFLNFTEAATSVSPAIAASPRTGVTDAVLAPEVDGAIYVLVEGANDFRLYDRYGLPTWAVGADVAEDPVIPTEYESGLYPVRAGALEPGRYTLDSPGDCAWVRLSSLDQTTLLDKQIGASLDPGSTQNVIDILATDRGFLLTDLGGAGCGTFSLYESPAALLSSIGPGTYVVGEDIEPGRYVSDVPCNWTRLSDFEGNAGSEITYDVAVFSGRQIVDVLASDVGFRVTGTGCDYSFRVAPPTPATQFAAGMYVVRSDIAAGRYVVSAGCSFGRLSGFSGRSPVTDQYLDVLGGFPTSISPLEGGDWIVDIDPTDIGFLLGSIAGANCQGMQYVAPANPAAAPSAGSNVVGDDIDPGLYVAPGGTGCFWMRLSGFGWTAAETIDGSSNQNSQVLVSVDANDIGFHASSFCGTWTAFNPGAGGGSSSPATAGGVDNTVLANVIESFDQVEIDE